MNFTTKIRVSRNHQLCDGGLGDPYRLGINFCHFRLLSIGEKVRKEKLLF
jgi:hypothetical protein